MSPSPFESAVATILAVLSPEEAENLRVASDDDIALMHFGLGMWVRNNLGLWDEDCPLRKQFGALGISDPDEVSGRVLMGARAVLNGRGAESALAEKAG